MGGGQLDRDQQVGMGEVDAVVFGGRLYVFHTMALSTEGAPLLCTSFAKGKWDPSPVEYRLLPTYVRPSMVVHKNQLHGFLKINTPAGAPRVKHFQMEETP